MSATQGRSWREVIESIDRATSESAAEAFRHGRRSGARQFVVHPLRDLVRGTTEAGVMRGVLEGYTSLVHAAKLLENQRLWREREAHLEPRDQTEVLYRRAWRSEAYAVFGGALPLERHAGGRGGTSIVETARGRLFLRSYRRGGAMRWAGDRYFGFRPRPIREFWLLMEARRVGLPVPEAVAAEVRHVAPGMYRGRLLTREIPEASTVARKIAEHADPAIAVATGRAIRRLFDGGLWHDDLNLTNVLVTSGGISFVDLDRARLYEGPLPERCRRAGLARLRRSAARHARVPRAELEPWLDRLEEASRE